MANAAQPSVLEDEPEQIDLLDAIGLEKNEAVIDAQAKRTGPGRPQGSRNKRTIDFANYLLRQYRSPVETLMQIQSMGIGELAAGLGCTKGEALQEIRLAAIGAAPYVHSKLPIAINVNERKEIRMVMVVQDAPAGGVGLAKEIIDLAASELEAAPESVSNAG